MRKRNQDRRQVFCLGGFLRIFTTRLCHSRQNTFSFFPSNPHAWLGFLAWLPWQELQYSAAGGWLCRSPQTPYRKILLLKLWFLEVGTWMALTDEDGAHLSRISSLRRRELVLALPQQTGHFLQTRKGLYTKTMLDSNLRFPQNCEKYLFLPASLCQPVEVGTCGNRQPLGHAANLQGKITSIRPKYHVPCGFLLTLLTCEESL